MILKKMPYNLTQTTIQKMEAHLRLLLTFKGDELRIDCDNPSKLNFRYNEAFKAAEILDHTEFKNLRKNWRISNGPGCIILKRRKDSILSLPYIIHDTSNTD